MAFALVYAVSPTLSLEDNVNYIRYPFMLAALAYFCATMFPIELTRILLWVLRALDFAIATVLSQLDLLWSEWTMNRIRSQVVRTISITFWFNKEAQPTDDEIHADDISSAQIRRPAAGGKSGFQKLSKRATEGLYKKPQKIWADIGRSSSKDPPPPGDEKRSLIEFDNEEDIDPQTPDTYAVCERCSGLCRLQVRCRRRLRLTIFCCRCSLTTTISDRHPYLPTLEVTSRITTPPSLKPNCLICARQTKGVIMTPWATLSI